MTGRILTLNAGSSSLKFSLYPEEDSATPDLVGQVEKIGIAPLIKGKWADGRKFEHALGAATADGHRSALDAVITACRDGAPDAKIVSVAHRIVHGGPEIDHSLVLSDHMLTELDRFSPYAPLHQPNNLAGVRAAMAIFPGALQVACFDTAFHRGHPWVNDTFALPRAYYDKGVRRYGFHGLSYDYISRALSNQEPALFAGRTVVAHLGNGASMCGLLGGQSIASTMGFSALDGLPMGTRSGQIDPGVLLYLFSEEGMDVEAVTDMLYRDSGLLGLSGVSSDMRTLEASEDPRAAQAIDYFVFRIQRELGAMSAALKGIDGLVFTGGIGENSSYIRARVCDGMGWMGIDIDPVANAGGTGQISSLDSRVKVLALKTDEESVLAREARHHLSQADAPRAVGDDDV